ncbi:MAG: phosphoglucosamine mutase [Pseudomonadota bacterium]
MSRHYFGTDGIRGKVGDLPMTAEFVLKLGWAVGRVLAVGERNTVLIGKDTRLSGYMLESALEAGLSAAGADIRLLGPMPTPGIAYLTRTLRAAAGIVISASHNPFYDNGVKFFSSVGEKLPEDVEMAIEAQFDSPMETVDSAHLGKAERVDDAAGRYIEFCKSTIPMRTSLRGIKLVVDCGHGATYHIAPNVFEELGARVVRMGTQPNGLNINDQCGATAPKALRAAVIEHEADAGIALDGDGDRLIMVDSHGEVVDGDEILFIIANSRLRENRMEGGVVGTLMTNLGLEHALAKQNIPFLRAPVGDRYVLEVMHREGWTLGGENSGHIICLDQTSTGDGIVAALQVLHELVATEQGLYDAKRGMEKYPQTLINVPVSDNSKTKDVPLVQQAVKEAEQDLAQSGRVLLRPSGTEPLVRVMVEGVDSSQVKRLAEQIADTVKETSAAQAQ